MANATDLHEFCEFLEEQIYVADVNGVRYGQPYVWGGQHTSLTPSNYRTVIHNMENGTGSYPGGLTYEAAAIQYCRRIFNNTSVTQLYAYDCSGLGMYFWQNVKHEFASDLNSNSMMLRCTLYPDAPKKGWWAFKVNSNGRAYHVGYMVDNTHIIEARGRLQGVMKSEFTDSFWDKWGIPNILQGVIPAPGDPGHIGGSTSWPTTSGRPEETTSGRLIKIRDGMSVNVRRGPSTKDKILFAAHGGDTFPITGVAETGWYKIEIPAYITNKEAYVEIIKEE